MKKLMIAAAVTLCAVAAVAQAPATSQATPAPATALPQDKNIEMLADDLHAVSRIAAVAQELNDERQVLSTILDQNITALRGPRPDGTYQWASLQREEAARSGTEKGIEQVQSQKVLSNVSVSAPNAYRVEVVVPQKRNLVSSNNRVYVRNIIVEMTAFDGKVSSVEIPVNAWVSPGDSHGEPLPFIAKSAKATAELGVESGDKKAVATVALLQAKLVDDPNGPYFPAVRRALMARQLVAEKNINRGQLKNTVDEALLLLPGELEKRTAEQQKAAEERKAMIASGTMKGAIAVGDATPDVVKALGDISRMLTGTLQEQADGRAKLDELMKALAPPPAPQAADAPVKK